MKYGARNQLTGTITKVIKGDMMGHVKIDIDTPASMSSVMTVESIDDLGINEGDKVRVVVKAINVLLVKE